MSRHSARSAPPPPCRLRDKAQIAERCRGGRRLAEATVLKGAPPPPPWESEELYCVYSLGQRFIFFVQVWIICWFRSRFRFEVITHKL